MSEYLSNTLEILSTHVAKLDVNPDTATTEFIEGDIPILQLVIRIGDHPTPHTVFLEREQCVRLRNMIDACFADLGGWLYTSQEEQEALKFQPPRLQPQEDTLSPDTD